jgi:hypothetical protein
MFTLTDISCLVVMDRVQMFVLKLVTEESFEVEKVCELN